MTTIRATTTRFGVSEPNTTPTFAWISWSQGENAPQERENPMLVLAEVTCRLHSVGGSVIPQSYVRRFPERTSSTNTEHLPCGC